MEKVKPIVTANCECKVGPGGTCSHISAILFYIEAAVKIREKNITVEKAYRLLPKSIGRVEYLSVKSKKKNLDNTLSGIA